MFSLLLGKYCFFLSSHIEDELLSQKGATFRCFEYSFVQFERLTSPEKTLENWSLEGRNTKEESNIPRKKEDV